MKGAVYYAPRDIRIEEVASPSPGPGQILIDVARNGICGSDLHTYVGAAKGGASMHVPGVVLGHEFSGIVRSPGVEVRPIRTSTREEAFCEVFFIDARIPASNVVGNVNEGWIVANSLLGHERGEEAATNPRAPPVRPPTAPSQPLRSPYPPA